MRDFKSYNPENNNVNNNYLELLQNLAKKYEGASESEIVSAILKEAEKGRRNGTLTDSDIDNFVNVLSPMLNANQKKQLEKIVDRIKKSK